MSDIKHHGDKISADEDFTPTLENTIVLKWLELIYPGFPRLVKQKYGAELRHQTLASIKPEISQTLSSLLDQLRTSEETRAMRTKIQISRFKLCALMVKNLDVEILAGMPFMRENDVAVRPAKHQIVIRERVVVSYGQQPKNSSATARRTQAYLLRSPNLQSVLLPGDFIELSTPSEVEPDLVWALEPRYDVTPKMDSKTVWPPPQQIKSVDHSVRVVNNTPEPILIRRHQHCCQIRPVVPISETPAQWHAV